MKINHKRFYSFCLFLLSCIFVNLTCAHAVKNAPLAKRDSILGITVDDSWYETVTLETVVKALKSVRTKPTVRIVMSKDEPLSTFKETSKTAYIMACPVDSYDMKFYKTVHSYQKRFQTAYDALAEYTDMWEVGNEINGEDWLGKNPRFIAYKVTAAYDFIRAEGLILRRLRRNEEY